MFKFFKNSNKKAIESYYTVHNLSKAQKVCTGKGVKIGIIDWLFGNEKDQLYSGFYDPTEMGFLDNKEHGYAMASTLKEIARDCQIYAINGITKGCLDDDMLRVKFLQKAVNYAIENNIQILTYSHKPIVDEDAIKELQKILDFAEKNDVLTIFLHCNLKNNIMPVAIGSKIENEIAEIFYIYQYNYNSLNPIAYKKWLDSKKTDQTCFLSWSSMTPVLAGFVALLLEQKPELTKKEIIQLLNKTSKNKIPNILEAVNLLKTNY